MLGGLSTNYALGADIDATATSGWANKFTSVGSSVTAFTGDFEGLAHTISNLTVLGGAEGGLFGKVSYATIKDLTLDTVTATGSTYTGSLIGSADYATVSNVTAKDVAVSGGTTSAKGGLIGLVNYSTLSNISTTGDSNIDKG